MLALFSSEEVDIMGIEAGELENLPPYLSLTYEELVEFFTHAVAKLNIDWPAEEQEVHRNLFMSSLDQHFLPSKAQPPISGLPFFPDLHTKVSRSWNKLFSSHISSLTILN